MEITTGTCTKEKIRRDLYKDLNGLDTTCKKSFVCNLNDIYDSSDSSETSSDEVPVWINGEQRWISGINSETNCADLVNVLLTDEGIPLSSQKDYVITERWRQMEQILPDDTRIMPIWSAWGQVKSEVKLTLCHIDSTPLSWINSRHEQDSGMGSPTGSTNSAIVRRRRHRASKASTAWITQAQTIHPKSQKATIEKLMKLILEQGETIQQQLAKLRDRELQINKIEEDRHKLREREHGKNYLLETYLNGLHDADEKEVVAANSDSGVQTEGAISSPEISSCTHEEDRYDKSKSSFRHNGYKDKTSHREKKLLKDHENSKEFSLALEQEPLLKSNEIEDNISAKIEWMEKLILINKYLQREEELLVRLGAKIRKYEFDNPSLNKQGVSEALLRVNASIDSTNSEIQKIELDIKSFDEKIEEKNNILDLLSQQLSKTESLDEITSSRTSEIQSKSPVVDDICNSKQQFSKPNIDLSENQESGYNYSRHTPEYMINPESVNCTKSIKKLTKDSLESTKKIYKNLELCNNSRGSNISSKIIDYATSYNLLQKPNFSMHKMNVTRTIPTIGKLGPKKFLGGICGEIESNSDTGLSSLGEDAVHLGTLV